MAACRSDNSAALSTTVYWIATGSTTTISSSLEITKGMYNHERPFTARGKNRVVNRLHTLSGQTFVELADLLGLGVG